MGNLYDLLMQDTRFEDALKACMNCGICTAICPAAEFYQYDPRRICDIVQRKDENEIEALLRSDMIWYCGQCLSCKTRCPRQNVPAEVILVLRQVAIKLGYMDEHIAVHIPQFMHALSASSKRVSCISRSYKFPMFNPILP